MKNPNKQIPPTLLLFSTIFLFLILNSCTEKAPIEDRLQAELVKGIKKYDVQGVSAAVVFPDQNIWTGISGLSHDTVTIKKDMLFAIGSITKNMVATLTLQLIEEGFLTLEDPISKYLPPYPHIDENIRIRQLLNHTSGIYMFWSNQRIWDDLKKDRTKIWTPEEVISYIQEPYFPPGESFRYSNTNYLLMAMIITQVTGKNLSIEFRSRFWEPIHLENTYLSIEEEIPDNLAHVFGDNFNNDGSYNDLTYLPRASHESITYGSAGLFMTAEDLAKWCFALFEGEVLKKESMDEMLVIVTEAAGGNQSGYGLGVQKFKQKYGLGQKVIGHSGANIGTSAYMVYLPDHNFSVAVMLNSFNHECTEYITKNLIRVSLYEVNPGRIIPFFPFLPTGLFIMNVSIILIVLITIYTRRRLKKMKQKDYSKKISTMA
jgi:D-alanyl-D-alanine carboxypeptidase